MVLMSDNHVPAGPDTQRLLRAFEPVIRLTQGEFFVPVDALRYVERAALWESLPDGSQRMVAEPGTLDVEKLADFGRLVDGPGQSLSGVSVSDGRPRRKRTRRPSFRGGSRLAQVGLLGRTIDTLSRLSLLLRGAVPGGSAALSLDLQQEYLRPDQPAYHGRVIRDGGWIVCQYWFFYSFNNWRSGFSGVNEHESDWEQVTIYLDGTGPVDSDGLPEPRWVVFSAHDEVGDDLRRRWDDPDLTVVDGRHPVVFAGAGSHSGAYLAGDYLITVAPPSLGGIVPAIRRAAKVLTPWTRAAQGSGLGIPYIDYARGDGPAIGPGEKSSWTCVLIDDETPWVHDFRGLWGADTKDRLGGERGPAGPRYNRNGTVRDSWADPVGWAGLAKVAPNGDAERDLVMARLEEIDERISELVVADEEGRGEMQRVAAGLPPSAPQVRGLEPLEKAALARRQELVVLEDERRAMSSVLATGLADAGPHAHLSHRRTPIEPATRGRSRLLSRWAVISTPLALAVVAWLFNPNTSLRWQWGVLALAIIVSIEAFARGYLLAFLVRLLVLFLLLNLVVLFFANWQWAMAISLSVAAVVVLVVNVRDALRT
jgi:hypothetical protein